MCCVNIFRLNNSNAIAVTTIKKKVYILTQKRNVLCAAIMKLLWTCQGGMSFAQHFCTREKAGCRQMPRYPPKSRGEQQRKNDFTFNGYAELPNRPENELLPLVFPLPAILP